MTIMNLFARIGLQTDQQKADSFQRSMSNVQKGMVAATAAATAYGVAIQKMVRDSMAAARALEQFNAETGASTDSLQRWTAVADQVAGAGDSVAAAIRSISENQAAIRLGQGDISAYQLLGIDPRQDAFEIMEQLRDRMADLAPNMQTHVLSQMGISRDMLQVLQMSRDEFDAIAGGAPIMSSEQISAIDNARQSIQTLGQMFEWLKNSITAALAPALTELTERVRSFMAANQEAIVEGLSDSLDVVIGIAEAVVNFGRMTANAVQSTIGWRNALRGLALAFAVFNRALLFSPIGMFMAAIVALILVMDDLSAYFNDDDTRASAFGRFMESFPELGERVLGFIERIRELADMIRNVFSGNDTGVEEFVEQWGLLGEIFVGLTRNARDFLDTMNQIIDGDISLGGAIWQQIQSNIENSPIMSAIRWLQERMGGGGRDEPEDQGMFNFLGPRSSLPSRGPAVSSADNRRVEININGGDLSAVRRVIRQELSVTGAQLGAG